MTNRTPINFLISLCFLLLASKHAEGQISNCNAFLKGNYVEAGVNWNGAFGSSSRPPTGYHPQNTTSLHNARACSGSAANDTALGFVADPEKNGWYSGTPGRFGDYLLQGSPQEGWSVLSDANQIDVWNNGAATADSLVSGMVSSIMAYGDSDGARHVTTQAIYNGYLYVTQFITLDTTKLFIKVDVLVENTSLSTLGGIYYMRTFNPHNDQAFSGNPTTKNKIEFRLPDTLSRTVVSTRGTTNPDAYLSIATQDYRAVPFISKTSVLPNATTIDNIHSGDPGFYQSLHDSCVANTAIGLVFSLGSLSSFSQAGFSFIYAFSPDVIDSTLNTVDTSLSVAHAERMKFNVFPNPTTNIIQISGINYNDAVFCRDIWGKDVTDRLLKINSNTYSSLDLPGGIYFLTVKDQFGAIKPAGRFQKL